MTTSRGGLGYILAKCQKGVNVSINMHSFVSYQTL